MRKPVSSLLLVCSVALFSLSACGGGSTGPGDRDAAPDELPLDAGDDAGQAHDGGVPGDAGNPLPEDDAGPEPAGPRWFEGAETLEFRASGAFGDAFAAAFAGQPDGIFPPTRLKDPFAGTFAYRFLDDSEHSVPVTYTVRGNSSLQECAFPKLKLELEARSKDANDLLFGAKKLKLGTHCGEDVEVNGTIGRFCNELSAWREELVYQLARALGILTLETQRARITYTDTSSEPAFEPLERKAFLLEHIDELARRMGGVALKDPVDCGMEAGTTEPLDLVRVKMFHALVGNWDFQLGSIESGGCDVLWNTEVLVHADGALTLVPADFDLAAMVVGEIRGAGSITLEKATTYARENLAANLLGEPSENIDVVRAAYLEKRGELEALVDASDVDDDGKANARLLIDGFFAALAD